MLAAACFFGGIRFERERRRREAEKMAFEAAQSKLLQEMAELQLQLAQSNAKFADEIADLQRQREKQGAP